MEDLSGSTGSSLNFQLTLSRSCRTSFNIICYGLSLGDRGIVEINKGAGVSGVVGVGGVGGRVTEARSDSLKEAMVYFTLL